MPHSRAFVSELILPTYEIEEVNPNPVYHETKGYIHPYPYPLQDSFAERRWTRNTSPRSSKTTS